jgi:hypothetical protein
MCFVLYPLADITVACYTFPDPVTMLDSIDPLSIVSVAVDPGVEAFARDSALGKLTQVLISIREPFVALPVPFVVCPVALVHSANFVNTDALTVTHSFLDFASV